jgi:hypothetical protein
MTITEAVSRLRKYAEELNIDLSEYDDEDLIVMAIDYYYHNIVDTLDP